MNPLNPTQRDTLFEALRTLEQNLRVVDSLLHSDSSRSLLVSQGQIRQDRMARLRYMVRHSLAEVGRLSEQFDLQSRLRSSPNPVGVLLQDCRSQLMDCYGDNLKGYGAIDPATVESLDATIDRLTRTVIELVEMVQPKDDTPSQS